MNSIEKFIKMHRKVMLVVIAFLIGLILLLLGYVIIYLSDSYNASKLSKSLSLMGTDFYENYYYKKSGITKEEKKENLRMRESFGVVVSLNNLVKLKYPDNEDKQKRILSEYRNKRTKKSCDVGKTKVTIYPKKPYGKKDYKIETYLECDFK